MENQKYILFYREFIETRMLQNYLEFKSLDDMQIFCDTHPALVFIKFYKGIELKSIIQDK